KPINANRIGDIFHALLAQSGKADIHFVHRVIERGSGDANAARLCHRLQTRGDVYSIAIDIVSLNNDVAEIDPNAKPDLLHVGRAPITVGHFALDRSGTLDSIDDASELDECAVPHEFDDTAVEFFYRGVDHFSAATLQSRQRADLILTHEAAVANHIGSKYCGKPALHTCALRLPRSDEVRSR